jgi:hypothetical protein
MKGDKRSSETGKSLSRENLKNFKHFSNGDVEYARDFQKIVKAPVVPAVFGQNLVPSSGDPPALGK